MNKLKKVVIFGTGDFGRIAFIYLTKDSNYNVAAFTANKKYIKEKRFMGKKIVPFEQIEENCPPDEYSMFVALGYKRVNKTRSEIYHICKIKGYELISYISSKAIISGEIEIGDNCFIAENCSFQPFVKIGNNVIIWTSSVIGHNTYISDHCFIAPNATINGKVKIEPYCFIGANVTIIDKITVAPECVIGAGAVIIKNTKKQEVYTVRNTNLASILSYELLSFQ